ncbi:MAG: CHC2 zinc finger domain-containing protein [bacterium]
MIEKEKIEAIKNGVNLKAYIESKGIALKKHGKGYIGLCPFHNDTDPSFSVTPSEKIWHCFGCGKSGNVFQFVQGLDKIDFKAAMLFFLHLT